RALAVAVVRAGAVAGHLAFQVAAPLRDPSARVVAGVRFERALDAVADGGVRIAERVAGVRAALGAAHAAVWLGIGAAAALCDATAAEQARPYDPQHAPS